MKKPIRRCKECRHRKHRGICGRETVMRKFTKEPLRGCTIVAVCTCGHKVKP